MATTSTPIIKRFFLLFSGTAPIRPEVCAAADVFLLCFKISEPASLFSALNRWCPEIRGEAPSTPIVLVGCQADSRGDRDILASLAKRGKAPVSPDQALTFSQRIAASTYVETSGWNKSPYSVFEVAALAAMGKFATEKAKEDAMIDQLWEKFQPQAPKTPSLSSRSASLASNKTRSSASIPSITSNNNSMSKTPKPFRRWGSRSGGMTLTQQQRQQQQQQQQPSTIKIKCQRLTADKTYEEIEVEVPAPIYETIQMYNDTASQGGSLASRTKDTRRSFGSKLKNLFVKN